MIDHYLMYLFDVMIFAIHHHLFVGWIQWQEIHHQAKNYY